MEFLAIELSAIAENLHSAREKCGKTVKSCAAVLGVTSARYKKYESGELFPSLPELETLSYVLQIPLAALLSTQKDSRAAIPESDSLVPLLKIRNSEIGTLLQIERGKSKLALKTLATRCAIPVSRLKRWESGQTGIPLDELVSLTRELGIDLHTFSDLNSPVGSWQEQQQQITAFLELPQDLQTFVCDPANIPYLSLANKMKELQPSELEDVSQALQFLVTKITDGAQSSGSTSQAE